MKGLVELGEDKIASICRSAAMFFEIGEIISLISVGKSGAHSSFFLTSTNGRYVFRLMNLANIQTLENELSVQRQLQASGIACGRFILNRSGDFVFIHKDIVATLSEYVDGWQPNPTDHECIRIGEALAKFHMTVRSLPHPSQLALTSRKKVEERMSNVDISQQLILDSLISGFLNLKDLNYLAHGVGHGDLHLANILINEERVVFIDFEHAAVYPLILDVARSMADVCAEPLGFSVKKMKYFLIGYEQIRPISVEERVILKMAIPYAAAAIALWFYERSDSAMYSFFINTGKTAKERLQALI